MRRHGRVMLRMVFSRRLRSRTSRVFSRVEQALGWYVLGRGSEEMVVHDGAGPSCAASIAYDATAHAGVVVLTNAGITVQDISRHLLWRDSPLARLRKQVTLNSGVLDRYVGTYQSPASPLFEILRDGDRLFIRVPYMAKLPFRAESEHDFYVSELQWGFVFDWDGRGRVREMLFGARRGQPMLPLQKR
jgi:hypothetical protein